MSWKNVSPQDPLAYMCTTSELLAIEPNILQRERSAAMPIQPRVRKQGDAGSVGFGALRILVKEMVLLS